MSAPLRPAGRTIHSGHAPRPGRTVGDDHDPRPRRFARPVTAAICAAALGISSALVAGATAEATGSGHPGHGSRVVLDGLDNPRQLAVAPGGRLLIAQTGNGGPNCEGEGEDAFCAGESSSITQVRAPWSHRPRTSTVIDRLPSGAGPDGSFAFGSTAVGVNGLGRVYGLDGFAGTLFRVKRGAAHTVADITGYEEANDPDGQGVESNPYSVLAQNRRVLVADAAANAVLSVNRRGTVSTFRVFPNITTGECAGMDNDAGTTGCDFVPTALAAGPRGSVYVTGLAAEVEGEGRVVKLSKRGAVLREWSGFSSPVGVAVRSNGTFYVSELFANADFDNPDPPTIGLVTKVRGTHRSSRLVPLPAGLAIIGHRLYVSAYSVAPSDGLFGNPDWNGQLWRLPL